jgi:hypothetical protein
VYHQDGLGNGVDTTGTVLRPLSHAWTSAVLDGQLYGEPLVFAGRIIVATENDTVYELAANTGRVIWSRHLATPVPSNNLPCGNIGPTMGITGTPVIDPTRDEVFVVTEQLTGASRASHHLYGLNMFTGATEMTQAVDPPGSQPAAQGQRPGLALGDGQVLVSLGGLYGDCSYYHGWEIGVPESGGKMRMFEVDHVGNDSQGSLWMGGAAPVVDPQGNVWITTGNGSATSGPYDYSDGELELSPTLALKQFFAPASWASDNANDLDLGSDQVALVGNQAFISGKSDNAYLLNRNKLGGIGHQERTMQVCGSDPDGGISSSGNTVYLPCGSGIEAIRISQSPPGMKELWQTSSGSGGPAIIASGLVWTIDQGGTLHGLSPATGNDVVTVSIGSVANHFPTPTVADGLLVAPATDQVFAFKGPGGLPPPPSGQPTATRYWVAGSNGGVFPFGGAPALGSAAGRRLDGSVVGLAPTPRGKGYWLVTSRGQVINFGDAHFFGSAVRIGLDKPIVGLAATPDGRGYWLVAADGGVFAFGDAHFLGSEGGKHLNKPVVGMAAPPRRVNGYWLVAADGGIFSFGTAPFYGSAGSLRLQRPVVGMTAAAGGHGYRLVASDGGIFSYGQAPFYGSLGGRSPGTAITAMAPTRDGRGYWMVDSGGDVFGFGDARFAGSPRVPPFVPPAVGIAASA